MNRAYQQTMLRFNWHYPATALVVLTPPLVSGRRCRSSGAIQEAYPSCVLIQLSASGLYFDVVVLELNDLPLAFVGPANERKFESTGSGVGQQAGKFSAAVAEFGDVDFHAVQH